MSESVEIATQLDIKRLEDAIEALAYRVVELGQRLTALQRTLDDRTGHLA